MEALVFLWDFPLIMDAIKEYENKYHRIMIVDKEDRIPECILSHKLIEETLDEVIVVDNIYDKEELSRIISSISEKWTIKAIYATFEEAMEMAGYLRDKFHIKGMGEEQAITVRNKYIMKQCVKKANIRTAQVENVKSREEIDRFIEVNGYPVIIKPIDGAATVDTYKVSNVSELEELLRKENILSKISEGKFIIEEFISGEEYHVDSIVFNGNIEFVSIGKYLSNCIETVNTTRAVGSVIFPSDCQENSFLDSIKEVNSKVIHSLKVVNAICHMEVFVQADGTVIFSEIATRIGGGPLIGNCIRNSYSVDIYKAFLEVEIGEYTQNIEDTKIYSGVIAFPTKEGVITKISEIEDYKDFPGLVRIEIFNKVGDRTFANDNTGDRTGYAILQSDSYEKLKHLLEKAYDDFILEVE